MSKTRHNPKLPIELAENDQESKARADHPDARLRDLLEGRFPDELPPSQSPKEKDLDDKKERKPKKREKKRVSVSRQLPKPKER